METKIHLRFIDAVIIGQSLFLYGQVDAGSGAADDFGLWLA